MQASEQDDIVTFPLLARRMKEDTTYHMAAFSHPFSHSQVTDEQHQNLPKHKLSYSQDTERFVFEEAEGKKVKFEGKEDPSFGKAKNDYGLLVFNAKKQNFSLIEVATHLKFQKQIDVKAQHLSE